MGLNMSRISQNFKIILILICNIRNAYNENDYRFHSTYSVSNKTQSETIIFNYGDMEK